MKRIVVLSGAGVSAESGIQTFRDSDGLWENHNVQDVASIQGWYKNRKLVLDFYNERRKQIGIAKPNKAHQLIAELEKQFKVTVVTQNIDNLHERGGSTNVIHLHGEATKVRPENSDYDEGVIDIGYSPINLGDLAPDGSQYRPHIVWFGEAVPRIEDGAIAVSEADILIIIGTSMAVYPAAGLINYAKPGIPIYLIDPKPINLNYPNLTQIEEVATKGMEKLSKILYNR